MKRYALSLLALVAAFSLNLQAASSPAGNMLLNSDWRFFLYPSDLSAESEPDFVSHGFDDSSWRLLDLPHDWGVEGLFNQEYPGETGKLPWWGRACYRKHLNLSATDLSLEWRLGIGGAMSGAVVWCNGSKVTSRPYGYSSFEADLSAFLREGDNVIAITLDNKPESSRWYPGGGIYRNVCLTAAPKLGIASDGVCITTPEVSSEAATVSVTTIIRNHSDYKGTVRVVNTVSREGKEIVSAGSGSVPSRDGGKVEQSLRIEVPALWSPESPELYILTTKLESTDGAFSETFQTVFGIRSAEWKADGFYLNGERTFLKGVCVHHDAGALGAAWNAQVWTRRLRQLKEMGCNAIRMAHNPPASELLDLCDSMGFLVVDELTDTWTVPKKPNGYATIFDEWVERDLVDLIRRDRNHPSVILWSIGNEVGEQGISEKWAIASRLSAVCHREDPTRLTTAGNDNLWAASQPYASTIDVYGFNYKPHAYEKFRDDHPGQPFYGSETASCISTRGYYLFPVSDEKGEGWVDEPPFQVSSYDLYAPAWASSPDYEWFYEDQVPECAGEFVWTGFDYLGEPTPFNLDPSVLTNFHTEEEKEAYRQQLLSWGQKISDVPLPSRSSYFGIIDLAGFPKDRYWLYLARWRPEVPVAHIVPHWNWPSRKGLATPVHVYSSADEAELFVNGKSQGRKVRGAGEYRFRWDDVVYRKGKVEVVTWKDGKEWAREAVRTAGRARKIALVREDPGCSGDLEFVTVRITDRKGRLVPFACNELELSCYGDGQVYAADAGDPTSHVPFFSGRVPAFNGLCSVIVRRTGSGPIVLKVRSKGLRSARIVL